MLNFNQNPFPENSVCKNCITRPHACKEKKVFDETNLTKAFSDKAKEGKEVWCFHPLAFIKQMSLLMKAGLTSEQKIEFDAFVRLVFTAAGDKYSDAESCKAIAATYAKSGFIRH